MAAHILLSVNAVPNPLGYDHSVVAALGDMITCTYYHVPPDPLPLTYEWQVVYLPLSPDGTASAISTATGNLPTFAFSAPLDNEGSYLVRLITDKTLPTESIRYLRVRVPTSFGNHEYSAAGETLNTSVNIPEDIDATGWANVPNQVFNRLNALIRRGSTSGRVLYVDANRGRDKTKSQNDPTNIIHMPGWGETPAGTGSETGINIPAAFHSDFSSIQDAIDWAANQTPAADADNPWWIIIRPGYYQENISFRPHIHLVGDGGWQTFIPPGTNVAPVVIETETVNPGFDFTATLPTDFVMLDNLTLINHQASTNPVLNHNGGCLWLNHCMIGQMGDSPTQGDAYLYASGLTGPTLAFFRDCIVVNRAGSNPNSSAVRLDGDGGGFFFMSTNILGASYGTLINSQVASGWTTSVTFQSSEVLGSICGLRSAGENLRLVDSAVSGGVLLDTFGLINKAVRITLTARSCSFADGPFDMNSSGITGASPPNYIGVSAGSCFFENAPTYTGPVNRYVWRALTDSTSLKYTNNYELPTNPGVPVVPPADQLAANSVQDAIDELVNRIAGIGPGGGIHFVLATLNPTTLLDTIGMDVICSSAWAGMGASTIYLPSIGSRSDGSRITVKDSLGVASTKNIMIFPSLADPGVTIDGSPSFIISSNWGSVTLYKDTTGWHVI